MVHARQAWWAVAILTLANVSGFVDRQILSLLVVPMRRDLGITDVQVSLLMGLAFTVFHATLTLPIARLADRGHRPRLMAAGVALWSLFTAVSGVARSFGALLLARIGVGVGEATLGPPAFSLIADLFPAERRARAISVLSLGTFLGSGIAYVIAGAIVGLVSVRATWTLPLVGAVFPWQTVFFAVGLPGLAIAALVAVLPEPRRRASASPADAALAPAPGWRALVAYVGENRRTFLTQSLGFACSATVNYGIAAWLATFLVRAHGWTPARAGVVQGVLTMTVGVLGVLGGGWLADRLVARGHADGRLRVGILGAMGMLVFATAYPLVPDDALVVALLVPVNLFAAMPWGAASAASAEIMPARLRAQGAALYLLIVSLVSGALGPTAVAWVSQELLGGDAAIGRALALVTAVGMTLTIALLWAGRAAYAETLARRDRWEARIGER